MKRAVVLGATLAAMALGAFAWYWRKPVRWADGWNQ